MTIDARRHAPATERNREPLLAVLREALPAEGLVLEVASGTGEHAAFFAPAFPALDWQPSDPHAQSRASIDAWAEASGAPNLRPALTLDAAAPDWPLDAAAAVLCVNMIHIAPWEAALGLLDGAARLLPPGGPLILYGPFRRGGAHTAPSNERFDAALRGQDPRWGIRDLDEVERKAAARGLVLERAVEMPANNLTVVFRKR